MLERNKATDQILLKKLVMFLADNVGSINSPNSIGNILSSEGPIEKGKNYIMDIGFRNMLLGYRDVDRGHILENIVYLELLRRDYRVYIGKMGETEVDFVAEKPDEKLYIQVTETMAGEETRERELRPLRMIRDNYEKIILYMDKNYIKSYEGIKSLNLIDFLLN